MPAADVYALGIWEFEKSRDLRLHLRLPAEREPSRPDADGHGQNQPSRPAWPQGLDKLT